MSEPEVMLSPEQAQSLHTVGVISYVLHTVVAVGALVPGFQVSVLLLLVAIVLDIVKRPEAAGSWQASHFSWRLRSVVYAGIAYVVTLPLWLLVIPGWIAWLLISVWFLYRIVQGWSSLSARRPMPL